MPRGFVWAAYVDDNGALWATQVDADYANDPDRGWFTDGVDALPVLPRGWRARRVFGLDAEGRRLFAVAAHVGAAIWAGTATAFVFRDTLGQEQLATIIGRLGEKRIEPRVE